jgi:hypothetical protein
MVKLEGRICGVVCSHESGCIGLLVLVGWHVLAYVIWWDLYLGYQRFLCE